MGVCSRGMHLRWRRQAARSYRRKKHGPVISYRTMTQTHVIVGGGLAAGKAAEALREEGFDGRVVLVTEEPERPYERPPLSKDYLRGEAGRDKLYVHDEGWYADHDVELRVGERVESLDAGASTVTLGSGEELRFDRALLATGAEPRRLDVPGAELDGVHLLRSVDDSDALRERLEAGGRVGAGGPAGGWSSAAAGGSGPRSRPRHGRAAWRSRWSSRSSCRSCASSAPRS